MSSYNSLDGQGRKVLNAFATNSGNAAPDKGVALNAQGEIDLSLLPTIPGVIVPVLDEGIEIENQLTSLNFTGLSVTATSDGNGGVTVNIPFDASRVDTLETDVTTLQGDVSNIQLDQTTQNNRLTALETRADETDTEQATQDGRITTNENNISTIGAEQIVQDGRLDTLEGEQVTQDGRLTTLETRADGTDTEQTAQDNRLTTLEGEQTVQDGRLDTLELHPPRTDNPHNVTATQVGLGNVDNTSDLNKPVSTATQAALDAVVDNFNQELEILAFVSCNC